MRNEEKVTFRSAEYLEQKAALRVREAEQLPPGRARQHALNNVAQLLSFADMKRIGAQEGATLGAKK